MLTYPFDLLMGLTLLFCLGFLLGIWTGIQKNQIEKENHHEKQ